MVKMEMMSFSAERGDIVVGGIGYDLLEERAG